MNSDDVVAAIEQSSIVQQGYTSDLLKTTFHFAAENDEYVISLSKDRRNVYVYSKFLQLIDIITVSFSEDDEQVATFDVAPDTGNIVIATTRSNLLLYNYVFILKTWHLFIEKKDVGPDITCVQWISSQEILVCNTEAMVVYLIKDDDGFMNIWEQTIPCNPIVCVEQLAAQNYFSCLTYNDNLIYIWQRTVIDLDNGIYDYRLILVNENAVSTMNKWTVLGDFVNVLYSLTTKNKLNIWVFDGHVTKFKTIDLLESGARFAVIIPNNKNVNRHADYIITFGEDLNAVATIHKIEYLNNNLTHSFVEKKLNLGDVFENGLTTTDFLYFNCIYNETSSAVTLVCDKLSDNTSIHFTISMQDIMNPKCHDLLNKLVCFSGEICNYSMLLLTNSKNMFWDQHLNGTVSCWSFKENTTKKVNTVSFCENVVAVAKYDNEFIYLLDNKLVVNNLEVELHKKQPQVMHILEDKVVVVYTEQVDIYKFDGLTYVSSSSIEKSNWSLVHNDMVVFVSNSGSINLFYNSNGTWLTKRLVHMAQEIVYVDPLIQNDKLMFQNSCSELVVYDLNEKIIYFKKQVDPGFRNCCGALLRTLELVFFVNFGTYFLVSYGENQYRVENKHLLNQIQLFEDTVLFQYQGYYKTLTVSNFDEFLKPSFDVSKLLENLLMGGHYEQAKHVLVELDRSILNSIEWNNHSYFSKLGNLDLQSNETIVSDEEWRESVTRLSIKLSGSASNANLINTIQFLQSNYKKNGIFINHFNLSLQLGKIHLRDAVLLLFDKDNLVNFNGCGLDEINRVDDLNKYLLPIWQSTSQLSAVFDKLSKTEYQTSNSPHDVGIFYLALGKLDKYKLLWKYSQLKEAQKISKFLDNYNNQKCLNNGYKLLSLHRYKEACWFFLLGQDYKSMFYTAFKRMDLWLLAVASVRILDDTGEKLKECLRIYCFEYFYDLKMFWEWFYCGLIIHDFDLDFVDLSSFYLQLDDLLLLLPIFQRFGSTEKEISIANKIALLYQSLGESDLCEYYRNSYVPNETLKQKSADLQISEESQSKKKMFELFNKPAVSQPIKESHQPSLLDQYESGSAYDNGRLSLPSEKPSLLAEWGSDNVKEMHADSSDSSVSKLKDSAEKPQQTKSLLDDWM